MSKHSLEHWISSIREIKINRLRDQIAPHKPLTLLMYLGKVWQNQQRLYFFGDIQSELTELLKRYSFSRGKETPNNPFVRLRTDGGIWEYSGPGIVNDNVKSPAQLIQAGAIGGLSVSLYDDLRENPQWISVLAEELLFTHFAESLHEEILDAVGLTYRLDTPGVLYEVRRKRNPDFRKQVALAYEHRCAVCKSSLRIRLNPVALEAAHIKWHARNGPDQVNNGLLLCSIHHKLLDLGAYTIDENMCIEVAQSVETHQAGFDYWLGNFDRQDIVLPKLELHRPCVEYLEWHRKNVFGA